MKNKSQVAVAIGVMCVLLTSAICVQLTTINEATKIVGSAYAEQGLKDEVLRKKGESEALYRELENKEKELKAVREEMTKENGRGTELQTELDQNNKLLGLTELTGKGILITAKDNDAVKLSEIDGKADSISRYLVHEEDLINIVNELNNAGAEAISINGQRILGTTSITCSGTVITINGVKMSSPFKISAIGNPESLAGINRNGGYIDYMKIRGAVVNTEKSENITVEKYNGVINSKYMRTIE